LGFGWATIFIVAKLKSKKKMKNFILF